MESTWRDRQPGSNVVPDYGIEIINAPIIPRHRNKYPGRNRVIDRAERLAFAKVDGSSAINHPVATARRSARSIMIVTNAKTLSSFTPSASARVQPRCWITGRVAPLGRSQFHLTVAAVSARTV